jgi:hypothetical protein
MNKVRLSATVDADLVAAAEAAVARGQLESVSAWVNEALRARAEHDQRLEALGAFIATYEAEHGAISADEMRMAARRARASASKIPASRGARRQRRTRR